MFASGDSPRGLKNRDHKDQHKWFRVFFLEEVGGKETGANGTPTSVSRVRQKFGSPLPQGFKETLGAL